MFKTKNQTRKKLNKNGNLLHPSIKAQLSFTAVLQKLHQGATNGTSEAISLSPYKIIIVEIAFLLLFSIKGKK